LTLPDSINTVVKAKTQLGHELDMAVVAEGCERQVEIDVLIDAGMDAIQGFYMQNRCRRIIYFHG